MRHGIRRGSPRSDAPRAWAGEGRRPGKNSPGSTRDTPTSWVTRFSAASMSKSSSKTNDDFLDLAPRLPLGSPQAEKSAYFAGLSSSSDGATSNDSRVLVGAGGRSFRRHASGPPGRGFGGGL